MEILEDTGCRERFYSVSDDAASLNKDCFDTPMSCSPPLLTDSSSTTNGSDHDSTTLSTPLHMQCNPEEASVTSPAVSILTGRMRSLSFHEDDVKSCLSKPHTPDYEDKEEEPHHVESAIRKLWSVPSAGLRRRRPSFYPRRLLVRPKRDWRRDDSNYWRQRRKQKWLIPAEHPLKLFWDILTLILSFFNAYATHTAIRDRQFGNNLFLRFCEVWFVIDIMLNFVTELKTGDGMHLKEPVRVWARYLTTWFVVDALALFPGEALYVQPIIEIQNRRGFFKKSFFRTKAVIRVTRFLRGHHFRMFGKVAKQTKRAGIGGASRLLRLIIKYVPKYLLFLRNMKAVVAVRLLRQVHWIRKLWLNSVSRAQPNPRRRALFFQLYTLSSENDLLYYFDDDNLDDDDEVTYSMTDEDYLKDGFSLNEEHYEPDYSISSRDDGRPLIRWEVFEDSDGEDNEAHYRHEDDDDDEYDDDYGPF